MTSTVFLELDSTYRDRNSWPNTGEFEIPIAHHGRNNAQNAVDPVSLSAPINFWTSNFVDPSSAGNSVSTVVDSIGGANNIAATSDSKCFIITSVVGNLQRTANYYVGLIANDTTISEFRRIKSYKYLGKDSGSTNDKALICVDTAFSDNFAVADTITINDPTDFTDLSYHQIFVPGGRSGDNAYFGYKIYNETQNDGRLIGNYNSTTHILTLDTEVPFYTVPVGWAITDNFSIRKETPKEVRTVGAGSSVSEVVISGGSAVDDYYKNMFLRIRPIAGNPYNAPLIPTVSDIRKIVAYDGATKRATISEDLVAVPVTNSVLEILSFSYDNLNPFSFFGSALTNQQSSVWEIELINASLPNKVLKCCIGRRIAFYPFIYIQLENMSAQGLGNISSNNPNALNVLFRCVIRDVANPLTSAFVNIDADKTKQIFQFNPNDNLKLTIKLPNGDIWKTLTSDTSSPTEPDFFLQTSVLFKCNKK
jgi:hypothetical protein